MGLPLTVENLTITGDDGRVLLSVPSLDMSAGQMMVVHGPSGAGKSTFLYALAGLLPAKSGKVLWGDTTLTALPASQSSMFRRTQIGFVFQDHLLFEELTAITNAALSAAFSPRAERARIVDSTARVLHHLQLSELANRSTTALSGGERQRVALARALSTDPPIVLADEPTAALDRSNADKVASDLKQLAKENGKTLVIVSHDPVFHTMADQLITLSNGRILA